MSQNRMQSAVVGLLALVVIVVGQLPQNQWQNQQFGNDQNSENCCEEYCYTTDAEPYILFATKTPYVNLNRRSTSQQHIVPDCTPIQFWTIIKHGARLPSSNKIMKLNGLTKLHDQILQNYEVRKSYPDRGRLCREDYDLFKRWRWNETLTPDKEFSLTSQGVEDMRLLARRYKSKYAELLQRPYDEKYFYFQYTTSDKTQASYQAYIDGLFGSDAFRVHANTINNDRLVRPYENCKTWEESTGENSDLMNEYKRFMEKPEYQQMERDVFRRLGFKYSLNESIIADIYDMCRYENAWNVQQRSPWCISFTRNHLKLLEYAQDLKYYYKTGYGNKMSEKVGCAPLKDFYERFDKTVNGNSDGNKATFLFTNSETMQGLLTALGVAKDYTPLTADNYYQQARRNWRTSTIDSFASNLAVTLYQCRGAEQYKVMFFLNEEPVEFQGCSVGLCDWSTVQQKYQSLVDGCNIDNFCNGNAGASSRYLSYFAAVFASLLLFYIRA